MPGRLALLLFNCVVNYICLLISSSAMRSNLPIIWLRPSATQENTFKPHLGFSDNLPAYRGTFPFNHFRFFQPLNLTFKRSGSTIDSPSSLNQPPARRILKPLKRNLFHSRWKKSLTFRMPFANPSPTPSSNSFPFLDNCFAGASNVAPAVFEAFTLLHPVPRHLNGAFNRCLRRFSGGFPQSP